MLKITLKSARVNANMTQEEVAKMLRVSKHTIINWEQGRSLINYPSLLMLSDIYNIPLENIFV